MRFRTRAFLLCFIPFALLLTLSFWTIQRLVQATVRSGLRSSMRENQLAIARVRSKSGLQNSRFLKVAGENAGLKAGMQLLLFQPGSVEALNTVEDQLAELCERMGFDFLLVSGPNGAPLAGVVRSGTRLTPLDTSLIPPGVRGLMPFQGEIFQTASVPLDQANENIGSLSVGQRFDFSEFTVPAVLVRDGKAVRSSLAGIALGEIESALTACPGESECEIRLGGVTYVSLAMQDDSLGKGFSLRSFQNEDAAVGPLRAVLQKVFVTVSIGAVFIALICGVASSRSMVKPISAVISHLRNTERTGILPEFRDDLSNVREIRDLTASFNRAARSVREARDNLQSAYVEFVGSLASALDARDRYTSGHSQRVSDLSCATAAAMDLGGGDIERIRIGALLHDIGKIGVADAVLQKPGKLTTDEFTLVKQHPAIGRKILEGVQGFSPYLDAVELHHENWNGSGYPHGQREVETPIDARIIHVCDAYDAMTTDRPYRRGMTHGQAIRILRANAGIQFDPRIVVVFEKLPWGKQEDLNESSVYADAAFSEKEETQMAASL